MTGSSCLLSEFEVLGSLQAQLLLGLAFLTFQTENDLTGGLCLLVEYGFSLSTETHLLGIITPLSLCKIGSLTSLVLGHLVNHVLFALARTVGLAFFRYVHHDRKMIWGSRKNKMVS